MCQAPCLSKFLIPMRRFVGIAVWPRKSTTIAAWFPKSIIIIGVCRLWILLDGVRTSNNSTSDQNPDAPSRTATLLCLMLRVKTVWRTWPFLIKSWWIQARHEQPGVTLEILFKGPKPRTRQIPVTSGAILKPASQATSKWRLKYLGATSAKSQHPETFSRMCGCLKRIWRPTQRIRSSWTSCRN